MKIFNLEESAQRDIEGAVNGKPAGGYGQQNDTPAFDKGDFGSRMGKKKNIFNNDATSTLL